MKSRILTIFIAVGILSLGALGGMGAQVFLMPYLVSHDPFQQWKFVRQLADWNERATVIREVKEVVIRVDDAAQQVVARAENMVVGIESKGAGRVIAGSGFVVYEDGFILTLASIVPQGYETRVYLKNGKDFVSAEVLRRDLEQNLAILKVDAQNMQTAEFASFEGIRIGAPVVMVAKSLEAKELITIANQGIVRTKNQSALRTNIFDKDTLGGSPLFDLEGHIVGLSTFELGGRLVAIPSSVLRAFSGL